MNNVRYRMYSGSNPVETDSIAECTLLEVIITGPRDFFTSLGRLDTPLYTSKLLREFEGRRMCYFKHKFLINTHSVCAIGEPIWPGVFDNFILTHADIEIFSNLQILRIWCKRVDAPKKLHLSTTYGHAFGHAFRGVKAYSGRHPYDDCYKTTTFFGRTYETEEFEELARRYKELMGERWNGIPGTMYVKERKVPEQEMHETRAEWKLKDLGVKKVIFNGPATIVLFNDGTKSVVKCSEHDNMSKEAGIALALLKHKVGDEYFHYILKHLLKDAEGDV